MTARLLPWPDVVGAPKIVVGSLRQHARSGSPRRDFRVLTRWRAGRRPATPTGPFMLSYTQYAPHRLGDLFEIWRAADRLSEELVEIDGAVGVVLYLQPRWRRAGSLSIWTREPGLDEFVALPYHLEIMRRYRSRGLPLRSAKWWRGHVRIGSALAEGQRLVDDAQQRRVVVPRDAS